MLKIPILDLSLNLISLHHRGVLLLGLDLDSVLIFLLLNHLLARSAGLLGDLALGARGRGARFARGAGGRAGVAPAVADRHLAEALLGALGVLETQSSGDTLLVGVGLLGHVVEDSLDEAKLAVGEAAGAIAVASGGGLLGGHGDLGGGG